MSNETLGERLQFERSRLGYKVNEFAALGGVGKSVQYMYENNERTPKTDYFKAIKAADEAFEMLWVMGMDIPERDVIPPQDGIEPEYRKLIRNLKKIPVQARQEIFDLAEAAAVLADKTLQLRKSMLKEQR